MVGCPGLLPAELGGIGFAGEAKEPMVPMGRGKGHAASGRRGGISTLPSTQGPTIRAESFGFMATSCWLCSSSDSGLCQATIMLDHVLAWEGISWGELVMDVLHDYLFCRRFRRLDQELMPYAEAQGVFCDRDLFR
jgi:hypothetical protein